jgi:hypothetical protein
MSTSLPERPNLDQLRRQAKELGDAAGADHGDQLFLLFFRGGAHSQAPEASLRRGSRCEAW